MQEPQESSMTNVELGQLLRQQPLQPYHCPDWIVALLAGIDEALRFWPTASWNGIDASPFSNTGEQFENETFQVHAYSWNDDVVQPWNFKCGDIEVSWYKHLRRGTTINRSVTPEEGVAMFKACLTSLDASSIPEPHGRDWRVAEAVQHITKATSLDDAITALERLREEYRVHDEREAQRQAKQAEGCAGCEAVPPAGRVLSLDCGHVVEVRSACLLAVRRSGCRFDQAHDAQLPPSPQERSETSEER